MKNGNRVGRGRRFRRPVVALAMSSMHLRVVQQRRRCVLAWRDFAQQLRIAFKQGIDGLGHLAGHTPDYLRFAYVGLCAYSEYIFPVVDGRALASNGVLRNCRCSTHAQNNMRRCNLGQTIRWEFYILVAEEPHAHAWLEIQAMLGLAKNTIHAYGRGANDYLALCQRAARPSVEATKADIIAYIDDMTHRSNPKGENIRYLHAGVGLANSTMQQDLTVVRLLYDYLIDERIRVDQRNPVGKGKFTPGRAFAGKRERGILRHYEQLPWIPGSDEWDRILDATLQEPLRNRNDTTTPRTMHHNSCRRSAKAGF